MLHIAGKCQGKFFEFAPMDVIESTYLIDFSFLPCTRNVCRSASAP